MWSWNLQEWVEASLGCSQQGGTVTARWACCIEAPHVATSLWYVIKLQLLAEPAAMLTLSMRVCGGAAGNGTPAEAASQWLLQHSATDMC